MSDVRGLAVTAVALKVLGDRVRERREQVNAQLAESLDPGDRKTAALDDGTVCGGVTFVKGRTSARITDPRAFTAWVAEFYPDEIERQVRPAFRDAVLNASKGAGQPMTPDGTLDVPGVAVVRGDPFLTVTTDPIGLPALEAAIRAGQLLALEGTE